MQFADNILKTVKTDGNFSFSKHTTYGLGGLAKIAYFPINIEESKAVFDYVTSNYDNFCIIGNGSNLLASDDCYDGAVISTKKLNGISYENGVLKCMGGATVGAVLSYCKSAGLSGLEYLAGIPASIGGLAYMNGGINGFHLGDNVQSVLIYDGNLKELSNKNCNFGNKHSTMRDINALILRIDLQVKSSNVKEIEEKYNYFINRRRGLPQGRSCGCVFKNPEGFSAGKLIEEAGLKGLRCGNAFVSGEHANFIINDGAGSREVYLLIGEVKRRVYEKFGVLLEEEVVYIGEFNETDG